MKIKGWMYGAGALAAAGVGVVIYEITKKPAAGSTGATGPGSDGSIMPAPVPTAARPPASTPGSFNSQQPPPGPILEITSGGSLDAGVVQPSQAITLSLPTGARWNMILIALQSGQAIAPVDLGNDFTSPASIAYAQLQPGNVVAASWTNSQGTVQITYVKYLAPKVVALHLHV